MGNEKTEKGKGWTELFLEYQKHERDLSEHTLRAYRSDLARFLEFLDARSLSVEDVLSFHVRQFLGSLQKKNGAVTIARKLSTLRTFYRFLERHGHLHKHPLSQMKTPKIRKSLPFFLTLEQVDRLISSPSAETFLEKRDRAILELLYGSGIRVSELVAVEMDDVDHGTELMKVRGKRKKERLIPIKSALVAIEEYLKFRPATPERTLFLNRFGKKLTPRSVGRLLKKYAGKAGIPLKVTPHTLRHTYATHLLDAGINLRALQELLGHSSLSATQIYTHLTTRQLMDIYRKSHPRA